jgi:hypothetical protein
VLGRTILMRFSFVLDQDLEPGTPVAVKAISNDEFEIVAPAKRIEITTYDPKWIFTRKGRFLHRLRGWISKLRFW